MCVGGCGLVRSDASRCGREAPIGGSLKSKTRRKGGGMDDFHVSLESLSPRYLQIPAKFFSQGASMLVSFG